MNRKDFSKPFFMSGPADSGWGGGPPRGGGWGAFKGPQDSFNRYNEAYGDYQGGYGPGRGFGPGGPRPMMPPGGPRPMMMPCGPMMPLGGPRPGFGFGPGGPGGAFGPRPLRGLSRAPGPMSQHNAVKFLQKCGVPAESLKNLPRDLTRNYLPNHCGVCKMDFDTFAFARLHYCSKNHMKNQKKWLLDTPGGGRNTKEPLKSRDLYCELCDVQITSKPHADSHYAGKPHRAVVLGRKQPKNTKLVAPGSKQRLEQLLKREKRFLKLDPATGAAKGEAGAAKGEGAAAQGEAGAAAAEGAAAKPKLAANEFYCEICKSAMVGSEQMTAHLNGKRHLSKEKQHILNMMKAPDGEDEVKPEEDAEGAVVAPENGESNGNGTDDNMEGAAKVTEEAEEDEEEDDDLVAQVVEGEGEADVVLVEDEDEVEADGAAEDDSWVHGTGDGWDQPQQKGDISLSMYIGGAVGGGGG